MWTTRSGFPIASSIGLACANVVASPPTMIDSEALIAPISPPLTGASSIEAPSSGARTASRRAVRRSDAAAVDQDRVALNGAEDTVSPFEHLLDVRAESGTMVTIRVDASRDVGGRGGPFGSGLHQRIDRRGAAAVHDECEPTPQEVCGHGLAHEPEPDESDRFCHGCSYLSLLSLSRSAGGRRSWDFGLALGQVGQRAAGSWLRALRF